MATGYLCIEYDKDRKGNTLDTSIIHELKRISVHEETNGKHFLRYDVNGKQYYLFFSPDGVDFIVADDADNPNTGGQAQRIYQTQLCKLEQDITALEKRLHLLKTR
ncbi:hypothetical protein [Acidithiobacillus sp.]|jgi:hypothetical protein|uniref:hypothetical protein n=1 Tax=Acidithiobacillus sp. TaxID=1872118 RepID=UPI00356A22FB